MVEDGNFNQLGDVAVCNLDIKLLKLLKQRTDGILNKGPIGLKIQH